MQGKTENGNAVKVETYTDWTVEAHGTSANRMVRIGPWKLCYYGAYDNFELFNLDNDPEELCDLSQENDSKDILEALTPEIFSDGWSRDVVDRIKQDLNRDGGGDNIKAYRDALRQSMDRYPRRVGHLDLWPKTWTESATLDEV
jgi:hypothetical protein